jgi:carbonic anhydrase/acetyltransferase-like protein (isoleucine patch superfamily)
MLWGTSSLPQGGRSKLELIVLRIPRVATSRVRLSVYRALGMRLGRCNRMEGGGRVRRCRQIAIGDNNAFTQGCWLWPEDADFAGIRIRIGNSNYFNRNVMIDACGMVTIGNHNMIGPDTYITDSNHTLEPRRWVGESPMSVGKVMIGDGCWIGANVNILQNVTLGDRCIVAAGSVVSQSFPSGAVIGGNPARLIRQMRTDQAITSSR